MAKPQKLNELAPISRCASCTYAADAWDAYPPLQGSTAAGHGLPGLPHPDAEHGRSARLSQPSVTSTVASTRLGSNRGTRKAVFRRFDAQQANVAATARKVSRSALGL
jgi:hypothetical protein